MNDISTLGWLSSIVFSPQARRRQCSHCLAEHNRDINAACNILAYGLAWLEEEDNIAPMRRRGLPARDGAKVRDGKAHINAADWSLLLAVARPAETDERLYVYRRRTAGASIEAPSGQYAGGESLTTHTHIKLGTPV
ncbi:transposase [Cupriavidus necator]|uniref:Uncharacterized protein n=1 Tax=Cupriavidus necator TaxID=106590 RepID=A0A367PQT9_CUPNE|nr:zinc ribbon domain-containing protein [Cupriavidus necator]QQX85241.1 transposase [Cupriavidus necator]RCJ10291.1 hypothetical protein DDK22_01135 [Cupriavidus necator]